VRFKVFLPLQLCEDLVLRLHGGFMQSKLSSLFKGIKEKADDQTYRKSMKTYRKPMKTYENL